MAPAPAPNAAVGPAALPVGRHNFGGGLSLIVKPTGRRSWSARGVGRWTAAQLRARRLAGGW